MCIGKGGQGDCERKAANRRGAASGIPPDRRGFVSLGVSVDLAPAVLRVARRVIAEVNPAMPRTHGESFVHLDRFDAFVSVDTPVTVP